MTEQLPRFNQDFVRKLPYSCPERDFVNTVGDVTFLLRTHADDIAVVDRDLRRPFILGEYRTDEEIQAKYSSFADDAEKALDEKGLHEVTLALNGLKVVTMALCGRELAWITTSKKDTEPESDSAYLINSMIGFYFEPGYSPTTLIQLADNSYDTNGLYIPLLQMWDIRVYPK